MKRAAIVLSLTLMVTISAFSLQAQRTEPEAIPNPAIDMNAHLLIASEAAEHRQSRRLTEKEFLRFAAEPGTTILDARSRDKFDELHIEGAINLPFPDITVASLNDLLPDKTARILIYCNNNFLGAEVPFPTKIAPASLNISTYIALYNHGYRNVYELGPLLNVSETIIPFEGTLRDDFLGPITDARVSNDC